MHASNKACSLVSELRDYLAQFSVRCRTQRWLPALLHVRAVADIAADLDAAHSEVVASAHSAEVEDIEAQKLLEEISADGVITAEEMPRLQQAIRFIQSSAARDHAITEAMA